MSSEKMKALAEKMAKASANNQEENQVQTEEKKVEETSKVNQEKPKNEKVEEIKKEEPTKAPAKRSTRTKKNSLEYALEHKNEKEFDNKERVYIDSGISQQLKLLKLATGASIGALANILLEIAIKDNEPFIKEKIEDILK